MAANWLEILALRAVPWGVPAAEVTALNTLHTDAALILATVMSAERTEVATAQCISTFAALEAKMRYIKRLYFNMPPRILEEIVSLGLRPHDSTYSPQKTPVNQAGLEVNVWAPHLLGFRLFTAAVIDPAEKGYGFRVFSGLVKPGIPAGERPSATRISDEYHLLSSPPLSLADLPDSFFTRRKSDLLKNLPPESSGMMCYLAARYEISKGHVAGPWGTLVSAFIP
jgi:hypothetical protein